MPDQPRRRISDRDRRRWSDERLDDRHATIDRRLDNIEQFIRTFSQVPGLMHGVQEQLEETQKDVRELRAENRQDHARVEKKTDTVVKQTSGPNWKEFFTYALAAATGVGVPILLAQVVH